YVVGSNLSISSSVVFSAPKTSLVTLEGATLTCSALTISNLFTLGVSSCIVNFTDTYYGTTGRDYVWLEGSYASPVASSLNPLCQESCRVS
ncbi:MAG: hypothetical protein ACOYL6_19415, partial [Bacteriovoracaceae bacterium]